MLRNAKVLSKVIEKFEIPKERNFSEQGNYVQCVKNKN
jgi:hypothetical protein